MELGRAVLQETMTPRAVHAIVSDGSHDRALCGSAPVVELPGAFADCCDDFLCPACLARAGLR
jgi:hypothetical protein